MRKRELGISESESSPLACSFLSPLKLPLGRLGSFSRSSLHILKLSKIQDGVFNMADQNWKIQSDMHETRYYLRVFRVAAFELEVKLHKFEMADPIWRTEIAKNNLICMKINWSWQFRGWFFMMGWFWLFYMTLSLLLCTFLLFCDFSHKFRTHMLENNFCFPGGVSRKGVFERQESYEIFFFHNWNPSSTVSNTAFVCNPPKKSQARKG